MAKIYKFMEYFFTFDYLIIFQYIRLGRFFYIDVLVELSIKFLYTIYIEFLYRRLRSFKDQIAILHLYRISI
jgi:hypothetical protein